MPIYSEVENALKLLDDVHKRMSGGRLDSSDPRMLNQVNNDLNTLLAVLSDPMFQRLCKIQDSVNDLGKQLIRHPSITPNDFDLSTEGKLILKVSPPSEKFRPFDKTPIDLKLNKKPVPTARTTTTTTSSSPPSAASSVKKVPSAVLEEEEIFTGLGAIQPKKQYANDYERVIGEVAMGREVHKIGLNKPEGSSLGFSVVGLKSQEKGELGIFVQEIQPTGIAAKDGRLAEGDQILAIDGQPLDAAITHQQAIVILQQARGEVEIVVARAKSVPDSHLPQDHFGDILGVGQISPSGDRPSSPPTSDTKKVSGDMVLNTEWAQVEVIELINDGTGLGFGIIGGRSTGVVVKTILPGGVADRDGRLQSGDHILQIGDVNLLGMGSEQVAAVLRQCGSCVRLVVARPIEPTSPDAFTSQAPIVPTRILGDPEELERHILQANGYSNHLLEGSLGSGDTKLGEGGVIGPSGTFDSLPEVELVDAELKKDSHGLGITIAGYVCEKEELSGIFVKSISEGSAADLSGKIQINDRIIEVDGQSLQGFTNHQAVEVLRKTGPVVKLKLERYHHGTKYDQLQSAISHSEHKPPTPSSVSALSLPQVPVDSDGEGEDVLGAGILGEEEEEEETEEEEEEGGKAPSSAGAKSNADMDLEDLELLIDTRYDGEILPTVEAAIMAKWSKIMGPDCQVVVSQLSKAKEGGGLGISLEGTVDVEDGREVRPHHYIRSILPDGPVGRAGKLASGDELLEVNGRRLLGLNHVEVVSILKDLPVHVRIVCARRPGQPPPSRPIDTAQDKNAFAARNILGGSLQNLFQGNDRLVKAKSDGSLASTGTTAATAENTSLSKLKSRSLEPLTGLAMWSSQPTIIELPKGDRGLGFSILDYQDPLNPSETLIVIRSLVPGGVAQQDGRLIPGDRLLAVNNTNLENATLDQAVQALKGAAKGTVRISVAKPLPLPDTSTISSTQSEDISPPPLPGSPPPPGSGPLAGSPRTPVLLDSADHTIDSLPPLVPEVPPMPKTPPQQKNENEIDMTTDNQVTPLIPISTERLITSAPQPPVQTSTSSSTATPGRSPGGSSTSYSQPSADSSTSSNTVLHGYDGVSVARKSSTTEHEQYHQLPTALEQTVKVKKAEEPLGINVELVEDGMNGVMVTSVAVGGPFHRDGRIKAGDYLIAVNNECLRNVTSAQARAILRRAQLFSKDLSVCYIPSPDAEVYRDSLRIQALALTSTAPSSEHAENNRELTEEIVDEEQALIERSELEVDVSVSRPLLKPRTPADGQEALSSKAGTAVITRKVSPVPPVDMVPPATQPTVQKRVVTHVTIFPSPPPPDLVQMRSPPPKQSSTEQVSEEGSASASASQSVSEDQKKEKDVGGEPEGPAVFSITKTAVSSSAPPPPPTAASRRGLTPSSSIDQSSGTDVPPQPGKEQGSSEEDKHSHSQSQSQSQSKSTPTSKTEDSAALLLAKHWGQERLVEVHREPAKSLGISIVGGKVDLYNAGQESGSAISGIFIKNVLPNSPAGKTGQLKTGDRILAVDDIDLRSASHERAVEVIRAAGNPVRFLVQSLVQWGGGGVGIGVTIANHEDSETSEGTETKSQSQSYSQNVQSQSQSQSCSTATGTGTCTTESVTESSFTTESATENGGESTQRRKSGGSGVFKSGTISEASTEGEIRTQKEAPEEGDDEEEDIDEIDDDLDIDREPGPRKRSSEPPELIKLEPVEAGEKQEVGKMEQKGKSEEESAHSSEEDDEFGVDRQQLQGRTRTKQGVEIDRASAGAMKRSKGDADSDAEEEDEFGYTTKKIGKRWGESARSAGGKIIIADLERQDGGLGISLAGHRDRTKMATYICGINPTGVAHRTRELEVGDEILEVNGLVLHGRSHLNASAMIKSLPHGHYKIVAIRKSDGLKDLSVKPIVQFPVSLQRESGGGLGIMIMEGKHAELGQGIFISDILGGSPAESVLYVGDMLLAVNGEEMAGYDYERAAATLKKAVGNVILVVCNPTQGGDISGDASKRPSLTPSGGPSGQGTKGNVELISATAATPDGKKEAEKPKLPPKPSKIPSPSKLISSVSSAISHRTKTNVTSPSLPVPSANVTPSPLSPTSSFVSVTSGKLSPSNSNVNLGGGGSQTQPQLVLSEPGGGTTTTLSPPVSVIVKPATPSPKMIHGGVPCSSTAKMTLLVKNRYEEGGVSMDPAVCQIVSGRETTIEINKDRMGLGLSIVGGSDTLLGSIIIHEVYPDGAAAKDGRLKPGDQLLSVNNEDFQSISHSRALAALRQTPNKVKMVVLRDDSKEDDMYELIDVELVKKSGKGLGLSIVGRKNGPGVFISDVVAGGIAQLHGGLMKGDMIINVDGKDLKNATQEEAASVLKTAPSGTIKMRIGRLKAAASRSTSSTPTTTVPATPTSDNKTEIGVSIIDDDEMNNTRNSNTASNPPSLTGSPPQIKNITLQRGPDGLGFSIVGGHGSPHGNLPIYVKTVFNKGAARYRLKRGDQILSVNGVPCEGLTHKEAVAVLKSVKGNVNLTILS